MSGLAARMPIYNPGDRSGGRPREYDVMHTDDTDKNVRATVAAKRPWETPRVESSEVFTAAGLACCLVFDGENQVPQGSQGTGLEPC